MYVVIEKMAHGLIRRYAPAKSAQEAKERYAEATEQWNARGYSVLHNLQGQGVILDTLDQTIVGMLETKEVNI